jgi:hypothetical protein
VKRYILISLLLLVPLSLVSSQPALSGDAQKAAILENFSQRPLSFTENKGQWDEKTLFEAKRGGVAFYFHKDEVVYKFIRNTNQLEENQPPDLLKEPALAIYKQEALLVTARFIGSNPDIKISGEDQQDCISNYYSGNDPAKWRTDVPNWSSVVYKDIYPGINLRYHGDGISLKYDFIVSPGANPDLIKIEYSGTEAINITNNGELESVTSFGPVYEKIPHIYQEIDGRQVEVTGRYQKTGDKTFGFSIDNGFNPNYPLIIDPQLLYNYWFNEGDGDAALDIAIDALGYAYVTGYTCPEYDGDRDVFVAKISTLGNSLIYDTHMYGNLNEEGWGIAVNGNGEAFIAGYTSSDNFPTTVGAYDRTFNVGFYDAFVARFDVNGTAQYSTYLGSGGYDWAYDIAIDGSSNAYITGYTTSSYFPKLHAYQNYGGGSDAFVTKINSAGTALLFSTFLGGTNDDKGTGIVVSSAGTAYITGYTSSTNFPTLNPYQTDQPGEDAFVTKLIFSSNPDTLSLGYSTYLGGNGDDEGFDITINSSECMYITGKTLSTNFPTLNAYQTTYGGGDDAFVTKFFQNGTLSYSTYLGGSSFDHGYGIGVDVQGNAYVAGFTGSSNFPVKGGPDLTFNGGVDFFVSELCNIDNPGYCAVDNRLVYSTYYGYDCDMCMASDWAWDIAVDNAGQAYVCGDGTDGQGTRHDARVLKYGVVTIVPPCQYIPGDVDNNSSVNASDVSYLTAYFKGGPPPPKSCNCPPHGSTFYVASDANGNCSVNGLDVTYLNSYLHGGPAPAHCVDCPPAP